MYFEHLIIFNKGLAINFNMTMETVNEQYEHLPDQLHITAISHFIFSIKQDKNDLLF